MNPAFVQWLQESPLPEAVAYRAKKQAVGEASTALHVAIGNERVAMHRAKRAWGEIGAPSHHRSEGALAKPEARQW